MFLLLIHMAVCWISMSSFLRLQLCTSAHPQLLWLLQSCARSGSMKIQPRLWSSARSLFLLAPADQGGAL